MFLYFGPCFNGSVVAMFFISYHKFPFKSRYLIKEEKKGRRKGEGGREGREAVLKSISF